MSDFDLVIIEDNEAHAFLLKKTLALEEVRTIDHFIVGGDHSPLSMAEGVVA